MEIEFSKHSIERLKHRKISRNRVIHTISHPDEQPPSSRERRLNRKRFGSKILEVVTKNEDTKIIIITAYYLKE